jgi:hypothetical protein
MDKRRGLWLLLLVSLCLVPLPIATAQTIPFNRNPARMMPAPANRSHHELPGGPDGNNAEEMMAQRLRELQQLHQLQDQVQDLLKDPNFVNNIKEQFDEEQLRQLREKILKGDGLTGDRAWNKLLDQAARGRKLDQQQIKMLRRWVERSGEKQLAGQDTATLLNDRNQSNLPPVISGPTPPEGPPASMLPTPEKSLWDRMQEASENWLSEHMDGLSDDMVRALTEMGAAEEGAPLAELLRNMKKQSDLSAGDLAESATGLSQYLPKMDAFLNERRGDWDGMRSLFREASMPSLPGLGSGPPASSLPPASAADTANWGTASLTLLTLGVFLLLVWKTGSWSRAKTTGNKAADWRLGSWPVAPDAVATRRDLIHAFEYLALLCLGRQAGTCNHRELAGRLAEQDAGNSTRRQAVEVLAWMYEQARYAPAGEALSPGELSDARHALCYLAGVTAA